MKKRVFFATLSALMLLAMIAVSVFPSFAADAVYYPNGTIILNEDLLNGAENFADNFSVNEDGEATYSWNEETGRVRVESTKNTVLDLEAIPEGLDYYTISADLYLTETTYTSGSVIFGMGINSGKAWSRSLYFQMNLPAGGADGEVKIFVNNYDGEGKNVNGGGSATERVYEGGYKTGESKVNVTIKVGTEFVRVYYDDVAMFTVAKDQVAYQEGNPFFMLRANSTLEIDNLLVYAGNGEPDPDKVIGEVDPIENPETEAPATTTTTEQTTQTTEEDETEATTAGRTTETPTEEPTAPGSETAAPEEPSSGGCGSSIGAGLLGIGSMASAACAVVCGRKRDD